MVYGGDRIDFDVGTDQITISGHGQVAQVLVGLLQGRNLVGFNRSRLQGAADVRDEPLDTFGKMSCRLLPGCRHPAERQEADYQGGSQEESVYPDHRLAMKIRVNQ